MAHPAAPIADAGAWILAQAAAVLPDTIVTIQAPIDPGWFERLQETLRALMTLAILVLTVAVVPAAWNFRKSYRKVSDLLDKVYADVNPLTHHASRIAENVDYVTAAVRADTQRASALLGDAERRLRAALDRAEARARDLEALVAVAQREAEHSLVTAASTAAGVREGVASLRDDLAAAVLGGAPRRRPVDERLDVVGSDDLPESDALVVDARRSATAAGRQPGAPRLPDASGPDAYPEELTDVAGDPTAAARPRVRTRRDA